MTYRRVLKHLCVIVMVFSLLVGVFPKIDGAVYASQQQDTGGASKSVSSASSASAVSSQCSTNGGAAGDPNQPPVKDDNTNWVSYQVALIIYDISHPLYSITPSPGQLIKDNVPNPGNTNWMGVFDQSIKDRIHIISNFFYTVAWVLIVAMIMLQGIRRATIGSFNPNARFDSMMFFQDMMIGVFFLFFGETFMSWILQICGGFAYAILQVSGASGGINVNVPGSVLLSVVLQLILLLAMLVIFCLYKVRAVALAISLTFWPIIGVSQLSEKTKGIVHFFWKEFIVFAVLPIVHALLIAVFSVMTTKNGCGTASSTVTSQNFNQQIQSMMYLLYGLGGAAVLAGVIWSSVKLAMSGGNPMARQNAWKGFGAAGIGGAFVFGAFNLQSWLANSLPGGMDGKGSATVSDFNTWIQTGLYLLYAIGGALILGSIIFSGMMFGLSQGNPEKRSKAWYGLIGAITGSFFLGAASIITSVLSNYAQTGS